MAEGETTRFDTLRCALAIAAPVALYSNLTQYAEAALGGPKPLFLVIAIVGGAIGAVATEPHRPSKLLRSPLLLWCYLYLLLTTAWGIWRWNVGGPTDQSIADRYRCVAFLVAMAIAFDDGRARRLGRIAVVGVALFTSCVTIAESAGVLVFDDSLHRTLGRAAGFYVNPNLAGLAITFGLAVGISVVPRVARIPVLLVGAAGIAATFSRGALLCLAVLVAFLLWRKELNPLWTAVAVAGVALWLAFNGGSLEAMLDTSGVLNRDTLARLSMEADDSGRVALARKVWHMYLDSPWVGQGLATERAGRISHNIYLSLAAEHGVLGILAYPALLVAIAWRHRRAVGVALVFLLAGFFSHNLLEDESALLCLALAAARPLGATSEREVPAAAPSEARVEQAQA